MISVAIAEDHPLFRRGLVQTVEQAEGMRVAIAAANVRDLEAAGYEEVDVVILDLHLPDSIGSDLVMRVRESGRPVLVVSASDDAQSVIDAIAAGAAGYLSKASDSVEILEAITTIAEGGTYISPTLASFLLRDERERRNRRDSSLDSLSDREREILALVAEGDRDADIAERLFITVSTVRSHLDRIRDKTGRRRRADLTRLAFESQDARPHPKDHSSKEGVGWTKKR